MTYLKFKNFYLSHQTKRGNSVCRVQGFGLLEVIVSMAILSITAMAVTQLVVAALRAETNAVNRRTAQMLLQDMSDRMRANLNDGWQNANSTYVTGGTGVNNLNCIGNGGWTCWRTELAKQDLWEWNQYISSMMPAGTTGSIALATAGSSNYSTPVFTITITWPSAQGAQNAKLAVQIPNGR